MYTSVVLKKEVIGRPWQWPGRLRNVTNSFTFFVWKSLFFRSSTYVHTYLTNEDEQPSPGFCFFLNTKRSKKKEKKSY